MTYAWTATAVSATLGAVALRRRLGGHAAANPVLLASGAVLLAVLATNAKQADFTAGTRPLRNLLAPATVALAVPLANQFRQGGRRGRRDAVAAALGGVAIAAVAGLIGALAGRDVAVAMSAKSVTTAIAVPIVSGADGPVELAAAAVVVTGVFTAVTGGFVLDRLPLQHARARAVALGTTGHAIATTEVLRHSPDHGGAAVLALIVNGVATAFWLPVVLAIMR